MKTSDASAAPAMRATRATIPLEASETDDGVVVRAELPNVEGVRPEDVHVSMQGDRLTIQVIRLPPASAGPAMAGPWLAPHLEAPQGTQFEGTVTLPTPVRALEAQATVDGTIVTVTIPKARSDEEADVLRQDKKRAEEAARAQRDREADTVTKESASSFPASDPPSWTGERT